jgi:hypothetical protein
VEQERIKGEKLEVTYSYWDGSGHRRTITVTKGQTIGKKEKCFEVVCVVLIVLSLVCSTK